MLLVCDETRFIHVVDGEEASWVILVLLTDEEEPLIWRQLHTGYPLDVVRYHYEVYLAYVLLV